MTLAVSNTTKGAALMMACMVILGLVDNFVVLIAKEAGLWQFHLCRSLLACGALAVLARVFGWRILPRRWRGVAIRSICAAAAMMVYFAALSVMPIAQVGAGLFTAPIFVLLFSVMLFRAPIGRWRVLAAIVGFGGVLLVLRPDVSALTVMAVLPMLAGVIWALAALSTRHLCAGEDTVTLVFWFFAALGVIGAVGLLATDIGGLGDGISFFGRGWVAPTSAFWLWTVVQAVGSMIAMGMLIRAYQIGETSYIAVFEYSFLISASLWAWALWGDKLDVLAGIGMAMIILSGAVIALRSSDA